MGKPWENDSCATMQACYSVYHVPVAATLWCGVPVDDVEEELSHARPIGEQTALAQATLRHPYIQCLEPRIRAIHQAIDAGELPVCREAGRRISDEHVAYERRHVYGLDLKEWAKKIAPTERPVFLFDEIERGVHPAISVETYQTLQAAHDAKAHKLEQANARIRELEAEKSTIDAERHSLRSMVDQMSAQAKGEPRLGERQETTYLNVMGGLVRLLIPSDVQDLADVRYSSQGALIDAMLSAFPHKPGISRRTLEEKFAAANRSLDAA
jgi:hypothetical protein